MKGAFKILLGVIAWLALCAYLIYALDTTKQRADRVVIRKVEIEIKDSSKQKIINPDIVTSWLTAAGINLKNREISSLNTEDIRNIVCSRKFVKQAKVYTTLGGTLHIDIWQRYPIARVNTINGYNFYITNDNYILPLQSQDVLYVPIISGNYSPPFSTKYIGEFDTKNEKKLTENCIYFSKLINFVRFMENDNFWRSQIVQLNIVPNGRSTETWQEPTLEIIPRMGDFVIIVGGLDNIQEKLDKLMLFYKKALPYEGWSRYTEIDLRYKEQIVCR